MKHYPGWGLDALKFLVEQRNVTAIGHETSDTDAPVSSAKIGYVGEYYILEQERYQIELLKHLGFSTRSESYRFYRPLHCRLS